MRPSGRTLTHMPLMIETVVVFRENDWLALMLNQLMRSWGGIRRFAEGIPGPMLSGRIDLDPPSERVEL